MTQEGHRGLSCAMLVVSLQCPRTPCTRLVRRSVGHCVTVVWSILAHPAEIVSSLQ